MQRYAQIPLVTALVCAGLIAAQSTFAQNSSTNATPREINTAIVLNGQAVGRWTLLERAGVLYASGEAFEAWQIRLRVGAEGINHAGQTWYPLASAHGMQAWQNFSSQTTHLQFAWQAVIGPPRVPQATQPAPAITPLSIASHAVSMPGGLKSKCNTDSLLRCIGLSF
jgi:outer membrane usher protein